MRWGAFLWACLFIMPSGGYLEFKILGGDEGKRYFLFVGRTLF